MSRPCKIAVYTFLALYVAALVLLAIGTLGWFGSEQDPLSGVFLIPLGLPWNLLAQRAPEAALLWIGIGAPLINLVIIGLVCRRFAPTPTS